MNRHVERAACRARRWLVARCRHRRTLVRWACSLRWWWLRVVVLVFVVPVVVLRWATVQVVGFGLVLAGWSPPLTLAGLEDIAPVEFASVPAASSDIAARHALLVRVEATQAREAAAQPQGYYYVPRRRLRPFRAVRALAMTAVVVWVLWWGSLFSVGMAKGIGANANGPHDVQLPGAATGTTR